jgi:hypothetical protein
MKEFSPRELLQLEEPSKKKTKEISINALGQAMDTTWGRSSTPSTASHSVKFTFADGNRIVASYASIISFISEKQMIETKITSDDHANRIIAMHVDSIKKDYKVLVEDSGGYKPSVSFKEISSTDSLEIIGFNVHNPLRKAYFRKKVIFEIS